MNFTESSQIWNGPIKRFISTKYHSIPQWWDPFGLNGYTFQEFLNYMTFSHIYCICRYTTIAQGDKTEWFKIVKQTAISYRRYNHTYNPQLIEDYNSHKPLLYSILNLPIESPISQSTPCRCGSTTHSRTNHRDCPLNSGCQCGSTTHFRTSHRDCPLNPRFNQHINENIQIDEDEDEDEEEEEIEVYEDTINGLQVYIDDNGNIYDINTHEVIGNMHEESKVIKIKPSSPQTELIDIECSVCMDPNDKSPKTKGLCSHSFHTKCIQHWVTEQTTIGKSPSCPLCRSKFV